MSKHRKESRQTLQSDANASNNLFCIVTLSDMYPHSLPLINIHQRPVIWGDSYKPLTLAATAILPFRKNHANTLQKEKGIYQV